MSNLTVGRMLALPPEASIADYIQAMMAQHTMDYKLEPLTERNFETGEMEEVKDGYRIEFNRPFTNQLIQAIDIKLHFKGPQSYFSVRVSKHPSTGIHRRTSVADKTFNAHDNSHVFFALEQVLNSILNITVNPHSLLDWTPRQYGQHEVESWCKQNYANHELVWNHLVPTLRHHNVQNYHRADTIVGRFDKESNITFVDAITQKENGQDDFVRRAYFFFPNGFTKSEDEHKQEVFERFSKWAHVEKGKVRLKLENVFVFDDLVEFAKQFPYSEEKAEEMRKAKRQGSQNGRGRPQQRQAFQKREDKPQPAIRVKRTTRTPQ